MSRYSYYFALLTISVFSLGCIGTKGAGDSLLFGTAFTPAPDNSCTSDVTVTYREISLLEDGDVEATYDAGQDKGIAENDVNGGTSWGYRSFETCIYPNVAFTGSIEFSMATNGSYDGRMNVTRSFPASVDGDPLPAILSFTDSGAAERQCFTFTRVDDGIRNTPEDPYQITMGEITERDSGGDVYSDGSYHNKTPCSITVTMEDDEGPGIRVSNISNVMEEPGVATPNSGTFRVRLRTAPTANVTVPINDTADSTNAGNREGTTSPTTLTFSPTCPGPNCWSDEQIVTVTSVDDLEVDGIKIYTIAVENTTSSDSEYNGIDPRDVVVYNRDQSVPGYTYERFDASGGSTDSSGGTITGFATDEANQMGSTYANFQIRLRSKPSADVTLTFSTNCGSKCNLLTSSLTFTPANWNTYQTVQVEGASDSINSGLQDYNVTFNASSSDSTYNSSVTEPVFRVRSCDNDASNYIAHCNFSGSPLGTTGNRFIRTEGGTSITWLIAQSAPASDVQVGLSSSSNPDGTSALANATINGSNYNTLITGGLNRVEMSHTNDTFVNTPSQNREWTLQTAAATGPAPFSGFNPVEIYARTDDNEQYYYINRVGSTSEDTVTTATIYVCLGASPTGTVVLTPATSGDEAGTTISPASISWNPGEQSDATSNGTCTSSATNVKSFTVNGADDSFADGNQTFSVSFPGGSSGTDVGYSGKTPGSVNVTNADNEPAGKAIFVTNVTFPGEMTAQGVLGADNFCNANKVSGVPSGTYKALIVSNSGGEVNDRTTSADWVLSPGYHYFRCTGSAYANCSDEHTRLFIADGSGLFNPLSMSTDFSTNASHEFWTGMNNDLSPATQTSTPAAQPGDPNYRHNCAGFTYQNAPVAPSPLYYGESWSSSGGAVVTHTNQACNLTKRLICVQQ
ncbi:MAG: hypothetical protein CMN76_19330 [Spirochaetaceae bacterium]|nr:hypothetical protein [Spirochaetaceae bacterium]|tara:strand:- start:44001 stop:46736 length:2736 start_codon:yes stop_codon:yes gene_type:complete